MRKPYWEDVKSVTFTFNHTGDAVEIRQEFWDVPPEPGRPRTYWGQGMRGPLEIIDHFFKVRNLP